MNVFFDDGCLLHNPPYEFLSGKLAPYHESPNRILEIRKALELRPALFQFVHADIDIVDVKKWISQVHTVDYLEYLEHAYNEWNKDGGDKTAVFPETIPHPKLLPQSQGRGSLDPIAKAGLYCFDLSCPITPDTFLSALSSVRVALSAAKELHQVPVFALTRPPGHHAGSSLSGGYCYLNNVAIAARYLQHHAISNGQGSTKIGIVDIDYHHGNGTQEIFYSDPSVLYTSIHAGHDYPYFTGSKEEMGHDAGEGYNANFPLPKGTTDSEYCVTLELVIAAVKEFEPQYVIVSLGVDTYMDDPMGDFKLTTTGYVNIGQMIGSLRKPTLFVMEGGYHLETIGENVFSVLNGFLSDSGN